MFMCQHHALLTMISGDMVSITKYHSACIVVSFERSYSKHTIVILDHAQDVTHVS